MREITPVLTPDLVSHVGDIGVAKAPPFPVNSFRELVEHIARLAYLNKDHLLFFRGQPRDYTNKAGASSFYPTIYREDQLRREEVALRFRRLERAAQKLKDLFLSGKIEGHPDLSRRRLVQWSVLQHYEVCDTPLLDISHSQRVACSFAMKSANADPVFVFVFGLPYVTHRISFNSEHDTVLVRLLSICPPSALRPYFQEGYLAGTADVTSDYDVKSELDFNHRLVAKFAIPNEDRFWGAGLRGLSPDELYPPNDTMKRLCDEICEAMEVPDPESTPGTLGSFITGWALMERSLMRAAQEREDRVLSVPEAIRVLLRDGLLKPDSAAEVDRLRKLRNSIVHGTEQPSDQQVLRAAGAISRLLEQTDAWEPLPLVRHKRGGLAAPE